MEADKFVLWFDEIGIADVPSVGGKNAPLGEMYRELTQKGVKVPYGFTITADAYRYFLEKAGIRREIEEALKGLDTGAVANLRDRGRKIRTAIVDAELPEELEDAIVTAYRKLCERNGEDTDVAARSSATAEDLPTASFAGQQETYLNTHGEAALLLACKRCFASLFTDRAISYRVDKGFDHMKIALSIGVQKMVRSDLASSGVMFSIGSNDLTQLNRGVDRDSELVAHIFDERNEAVKDMVSNVIKAAKKSNRKIGICGQAPSDYPEFAEFLVEEGIDSISLNPDAVIKTTLKIATIESR